MNPIINRRPSFQPASLKEDRWRKESKKQKENRWLK